MIYLLRIIHAMRKISCRPVDHTRIENETNLSEAKPPFYFVFFYNPEDVLYFQSARGRHH